MAAYQYVYVMKGLSKAYPGGKEVVKDVWLSFLPGVKIGVLGPNGSGKSTLLKIMAGVDKEYNGEAWAAEGVKIGYLAQEPELDPDLDVKGNVMLGLAETKNLLDRFEAVSLRFGEELSDDEMNDLIMEQGELQEKIDAVNGWELERTIEIAMDALNCPPGDSPVTKLSGGERRRVALCRLLLQKPDLLLLDEPTNHLDASSVAWLQRYLKDYEGTVITVTHDRYFLDEVATWILEVDRGRTFPHEGNYTSWLTEKQKRLELENKTEVARQRTIAKELEWVRASPRARQAKSKARLQAYDELVAQSKEKAPDTARLSEKSPIPAAWGSLLLPGYLAGLVLVVLRSVWHAHKGPERVGARAMSGLSAEVLDWSGNEGHVLAHGERWRARSAEVFKPGDVVEVANIVDLTLVVRRWPALAGERGAS